MTTILEIDERISEATEALTLLVSHRNILARWDYSRPENRNKAWDEATYAHVIVWNADITIAFHGPDLKVAMAEVRMAFGGKWNKGGGDYTFTLRRKIGSITVELSATREKVCTRKVVGTKEVTLPPVEAKPERTEVQEIVEWDCGPILPTELEA